MKIKIAAGASHALVLAQEEANRTRLPWVVVFDTQNMIYIPLRARDLKKVTRKKLLKVIKRVRPMRGSRKYARNPEIVIVHNPQNGRSKMKKRRKGGRRKVARNFKLRVRQGGKLRTMKSLRKRLGKKAKSYFRGHAKYHGRKLITSPRRACKTKRTGTKAKHSTKRKARKGKKKAGPYARFSAAQWKTHRAQFMRLGVAGASQVISKAWAKKKAAN